MSFFNHEDLGNHLLQLCPKVVKHLYIYSTFGPSWLVIGRPLLLPTWWGEGEGHRYNPPVARGTEGGSGPGYVAWIFVFIGSVIICQLYKLTLSEQAQITLQLTVSLIDLVLRILASTSLLGSRSRPRRPWNKEHNSHQTLTSKPPKHVVVWSPRMRTAKSTNTCMKQAPDNQSHICLLTHCFQQILYAVHESTGL